MSSLVSGVGKIFSSLGSGVARLGSAVKGIGASVFTASAATGSSASGLGGLFSGGSGILGSMFNGVSSLFGGSTIGTTAGNFAGPWGQSLEVAGATSAAGAAGAGKGLLGGLGTWAGDFLKSEGGAGLIAGLGTGIGQYQQMQSIEDMQQKNFDHLNAAQQKVTDSYEGLGSSLITGNDKPRQRTPTARIKIPQVAVYDQNSGMISMQNTA